MKDEQILECCNVILDFLEDETPVQNFHECEPLVSMSETLKKYNFDNMSEFTLYLNGKYEVYEEPLWIETAKEFFASTKAIPFYKSIIRQLKINLCLN